MGVTPIDPDVQKLIKFSPARICCSLCRHIRSYAKINPDGHLVVKLEWALLHRGDTRLAVPLPAIATLERTGQAAQTSPLTFVAVRLAAGVHPKVAIEHLGHNRVGMDLFSHVPPGMQQDAATRVDTAFQIAKKKRAESKG